MNNNLMSSCLLTMRRYVKVVRVVMNTEHNQLCTTLLGGFDDLFQARHTLRLLPNGPEIESVQESTRKVHASPRWRNY